VHAGLVPAFRFVISEVVSSVTGFKGPVLAGPVLEASGQLKVGDWLDIHTPSRQVRIQCEGFPLLNWGRPNWVSIAVRRYRPHGHRYDLSANRPGLNVYPTSSVVTSDCRVSRHVT
jgi:hypothetical protein